MFPSTQSPKKAPRTEAFFSIGPRRSSDGVPGAAQACHGGLVERGGPEDRKLHSRLLGLSGHESLGAAPWWMLEDGGYRAILPRAWSAPIQGLVKNKANVGNDFWTTPSASLKYNPGLPWVRRAGILTPSWPKVQNPWSWWPTWELTLLDSCPAAAPGHLLENSRESKARASPFLPPSLSGEMPSCSEAGSQSYTPNT